MGKFSVIFGVFVLFVTILRTSGQSCSATCQPPSCSCPRFSYPMDRKDIPQMVYFGFDDAVNVVMSGLYNRIFTEKRKNPNGCRVKMTLFISHQYTEYERVKKFYESGHEIAVHSVTHKSIDNDDILRREAKKQKENLVKLAGVPAEEIIGWRSPFLKTAGNNQPEILKELGYEYDISMTYSRQSADIPKPWPFTMDNGWPYKCGIQPCPTQARTSNFWAVPVVSLMDHENKYPCSFVDGCTMRANNEEEAFKYLMENFMTYYNTTRTPFGLNMHAAWFYTRYNLKAMNRFLDELHKMDDVYVVSVKQMLDWMKEPTPLSEIHTLKSWGCPEAHQVVAEHKPSPIVRPTPMGKPVQPASRGSTAHVIPNTWITERRIQSRTGRPVVVPRWHFINTNPPTPRPTTTTTTTTTTPTTTTTTPTTTTPTTTTTTPTTTTTTPTTTTTTPTTTTTTPTTTTTTPTTTTTTPTTTTTTPTTTTTTPTTTTTTPTTTTTKPTTTTTTPSTTTSTTTTSTTSVTTPSTPSRSQIANNDDITSSRNNVRTIERPSVWNSGSPTSRIIPSPNSIDSNDRFLDIMSVTPPNNSPRRWWAFWRPSTSSRPKGCVQGVSCKLPNCFCEGTKIPGNLNLKDTPQLIYITIDGSINAALYRRYRQLVFKRRNPNGCVIRGTIYASERGSFERITRRLSKVGAEIAMSGVNEHSYTSSDQMEDEIVTQMTSLEKSNVTSVGWKTPELKALGDEQFRLLKKYGFKYDATLTATHPERGGYKPWPFTLDYGYKADCVIPECPTKSFPGLWELPATALLDYKKMFGCNYADGCMLNPPTSKTTESYLWDNFMYNYETNKAPLGLHLRQVWFRHPAYADNIKGLQAFIKRVLTLKDVYIVSGQDVITWMENPVKVKDITDTVPWQCKS